MTSATFSGRRPLLLGVAVVCLAMLTAADVASAQQFRMGSRRSPLPRSSELAPLQLERSWWGQATVSYGRDEIRRIHIDEDNVYTISKQGLITGFNAETGQRLFSTLLGSDSQRAEEITTNSTTLMAPIGMTLIAIDKFSGTEMWKLNLDGQPSCGPGSDDDRVYVGTVDGSVYAYDLRRIRKLFNDGRLPEYSHVAREWRFQAFGEVTAAPVSTGRDLNFATRKGVMYGLISKDRKLIYQFMTGGNIVTPISRSPGRVIIPSTDLNVYSISDVNGQTQWTFPTGTPVYEAPALIRDRIYVVPERRGLYAVDMANGRELWRQPVAGKVLSATSTSVFADGLGGNLYRLDRESGEVTGTLPLPAFTVRQGNERTDRLFLCTPNGLLVCLKETGRDFPTFYQFPDRAPIMPELSSDSATDEPAATEPAAGGTEPAENPFGGGNSDNPFGGGSDDNPFDTSDDNPFR